MYYKNQNFSRIHQRKLSENYNTGTGRDTKSKRE